MRLEMVHKLSSGRLFEQILIKSGLNQDIDGSLRTVE